MQMLSTLNDVQKLYTWFKRMRSTKPILFDERNGRWHAFRYTDVHTVITNYSLFSSEGKKPTILGRAASSTAEDKAAEGPSLIAMDPPKHRQYHDLVSRAFTTRAIESLKGRIATMTEELLEKARADGHMDFATDFAYPLPTMVIAEILGIPPSDQPQFKQWADVMLRRQISDPELSQFTTGPAKSSRTESRQNVADEMSEYFLQQLEARQRAPRDDMMSQLLAAEIDGEHLSMEEAINFCSLLLLAGHSTTTNLLSHSIRCFDEHPGTIERLLKQPELMPDAIEEVLRYATPVWRLMRTTKTDVTIGDVTIPKDATIFAWLSSANRDDEQFPEPERFDIMRTPNRHVGFGHGIHFCIGAPLSRLEAAIALPIILQRLPNLHVLRDDPIELFRGRLLFGIKHLPITFDV